MTKIKINKTGDLYIEKAGECKLVSCPYTSIINPIDGGCVRAPCNHLCALFNDTHLKDENYLELCHAVYTDMEIIDERKEDG